MTSKRVFTAVALIAVIGAAFYLGRATDGNKNGPPTIPIVDTAQAMPPLGDGSFTICELYYAFTALEDAFGYFADVVEGVRCSGIDCDRNFDIPDDIGSDLDEIKERFGSGGRERCETQPCYEAMTDFMAQLQDVLEKAPAVAPALEAVLQAVPEDQRIEFLSRGGRDPRMK